MGSSSSEVIEKAKNYGIINTTKKNVIFIVGAPGTSISTMCSKLIEEFKFSFISTSDTIKTESSNTKSLFFNALMTDIQNGLVDSSKVVQMLKLKIMASQEQKILLEGFPKCIENIDQWTSIMSQTADIVAMCLIDISNDEIMKTKASLKYSPNEVNEKINTYINQTRPACQKYKEQFKLMVFNGEKNDEDLFTELKTAFIEHQLYL